MPDGSAWPAISVVTPSYNQAEFLEETLRSVLLQGYPNLEYIVLDGGSQDASQDILRRYAPWLAFWRSEPDRGQSHAINKGWEQATGNWLAYLNSDDTYLPGCLARVAGLAAAGADTAVIAGGIAYTDADSRVRVEKAPFLHAGSPVDLSLLDPGDWFIPQQSSFFNHELMNATGLYLREDLHFTMDRELMYRICRLGKVVLVEEPLATDRSHAQSKRIAQTLKLYSEDAAALAYCTWGSRRDAQRRRDVARKRMAQGHIRYAGRVPSASIAVKHMFLAVVLNPVYLARPWFYKALVRRIKGNYSA
jgi:glycosyltransferase involved in cell wall biosynthesis